MHDRWRLGLLRTTQLRLVLVQGKGEKQELEIWEEVFKKTVTICWWKKQI